MEAGGLFQPYFSQMHFAYFQTHGPTTKTGDDNQIMYFFLPCFKMNALLFYIQYGHARFLAVIQTDNILYAGKSLIVHIKEALMIKFCLLDIL